jgi:hypothetical protein
MRALQPMSSAHWQGGRVATRPETTGFISRKSAAGDNGEWLVVVHWRSVADAEASMGQLSWRTSQSAIYCKD